MEFFLQKDTVMDIKTDIFTRLRAKKGEVERRSHGKRNRPFWLILPWRAEGGE
jgi:hypothetical protein